jgi:hypothetical protein
VCTYRGFKEVDPLSRDGVSLEDGLKGIQEAIGEEVRVDEGTVAHGQGARLWVWVFVCLRVGVGVWV